MIETSTERERVVLVSVWTDGDGSAADSLDELAELARTAGVEVVGRMVQNLASPHPGTYLGSGKIEEVKALCAALDADGIICDDELSPAQLNNLTQALDCKVTDRTILILDIFAGRARTSEGKIQVELAQLKYRQARLVGLRSSLSRLGGGIGTRGPGEKKLEMDRRLIAGRISALRKELEEVRRHRELVRGSRERSGKKTIAIVGYTNAGKSTLLNTLTNAGILEEDALFATLDPTTRALDLEDGSQVLLTDTVGFIRKLPHHLVDAFRSTLEETVYADILLHVVDLSNEKFFEQMQVVYDTLHDLGADDKPIITLLNKVDRLSEKVQMRDFRADHTVYGSARSGQGLDELKARIQELVLGGQILVERLFGYEEAGKIAWIRAEGHLLEEDYREGGIFVRAYVPQSLYGRL